MDLVGIVDTLARGYLRAWGEHSPLYRTWACQRAHTLLYRASVLEKNILGNFTNYYFFYSHAGVNEKKTFSERTYVVDIGSDQNSR